jgi:PAS domain S-box-containing protein
MRHERIAPKTAPAIFLTVSLSIALFLFRTPALALDRLTANTQYAVSSWLSDDGLPQNWIGAIAQTPDGYLWFATEEGVARFDGARFTTFLVRKSIGAMLVTHDGSLWISVDRGLARYKDHTMTSYSTRDGLREGPINSMSEGPDGSIWMATRSGLNRYYQGKFTAYTVTDGSVASWIWSTTVTADGAFWWGTNGGGLKRLYNGSVTTFTTSDGLADNIVFAIRQDRKGDLWIGTNNGLSRMHDGKITTVPKADGLSNQCVKVIQEDRDGNLWIGTDGGGLNRYSAGRFTSFGTQHRLSNASVLSLLEDREGSLWVGTSGGGVSQLRPSKFITIGPAEGLNADMVWSVREAMDGSLLIGTNHGFWRWNRGAVTSLTVRQGLSSDIVRSVMEDRSGGIWLGTNDGINRYQNGKVTVFRTPDGLPDNTVRTAIEDREGNIWIGTRGGGLACYRDGVFKVFNSTNGLSGDLIVSMSEDHDGSLWIASNGGVSVLNNGVFTNYGVREGLSTNSVRVIHHDHEGGHWVGTYGGGLNRIKNGRVSRISVSDGLFDEVIFAIVEDRKGYLWMTCNRGVFRVSIRELNDFAEGRIKRIHSTSFDITDGMKAAECNGGSPGAWEGRDGRLFFATVRGVAIIDPNHIAINAIAPPVWNEEVLLDGNAQGVSFTSLVVGPGRHTLDIQYTALSLVAPKKVAFRYRLRGFSDEWIDAGNRRVAFFTNLPPGNYLFEVVGSNNDGVWSLARNPLRFHFRAAFYQTWWFWIACAVLMLIAVRAAFSMRLRLLNERERQLVKRVTEQTAELTAAKESAERAAEVNEELSRSKQLILNSAGEGIFGLNADGIATFVNPSAARMLEWPVEELVGKNLHLLIHAESTGAGVSLASCEVCSGGAQGSTLISRTANFRCRSGRTFPVEYAAGAIVDRGNKGGVVVTFRDVTERRAVEQLKSEFVSTVSHELRTPLTSIRGALGLLSSGMLGPIGQKGQRMLEIAVTNTDRLVRLINDILDLERIESGKVALTRGSVDAQTLLLQATEGLQSIAEKADVRIVVKPAAGTLWGDSDRIIQTLTNLLGNAIKFSPRQTTVTVSGSAQEGDFVFCVADEGRGVPAGKLATIFERFSQVDTSDSRDKGGSGLGLAICQSIVAAHGGRIWAEKNDPAGSRFQFTIPIAKKDGQHAA